MELIEPRDPCTNSDGSSEGSRRIVTGTTSLELSLLELAELSRWLNPPSCGGPEALRNCIPGCGSSSSATSKIAFRALSESPGAIRLGRPRSRRALDRPLVLFGRAHIVDAARAAIFVKAVPKANGQIESAGQPEWVARASVFERCGFMTGPLRNHTPNCSY